MALLLYLHKSLLSSLFQLESQAPLRVSAPEHPRTGALSGPCVGLRPSLANPAGLSPAPRSAFPQYISALSTFSSPACVSCSFPQAPGGCACLAFFTLSSGGLLGPSLPPQSPRFVCDQPSPCLRPRPEGERWWGAIDKGNYLCFQSPGKK